MWPWDWTIEKLLNGFLDWMSGKALDALNSLWRLLSGSFLVVPEVTGLPQVNKIMGTSTGVVNACFVLAILVAGVTVMTHETVHTRYGVAELAPRLVIGLVAANFARPICWAAIQGGNVLTSALTGEGIASQGSLGQLRATIDAAIAGPDTVRILLVVIIVLLAVLVALLFVSWLVRLGVLVVLVGIAPVALACHALPYTEPAARLWWRCMLGTVATVVLQAIALHTTLAVFLDPTANLHEVGMPDGPTGLMNLFIVLCLLWTTLKIPTLMRRYALRGGTNSGGAYIVRLLVVQQLGRTMRGRGAIPAGGGRRLPAARAGWEQPPVSPPRAGRWAR